MAAEQFAAAGKATAARSADKRNVIVFKEPGRYGGWPANGGLWSWGNEIVVGFTAAWYSPSTGHHAVDLEKPHERWQARSLDGGETWTVETPERLKYGPRSPEVVPLSEPLDFTHPDFAMMFAHDSIHVGSSCFYVSTERCRTWQGAYSFAVDVSDKIAARTNYLVEGKR